MKDAQKPDHVSLNTLVNYLRDGRFVIPDFQREFEWKPWDIRELMRSVFLDYYIGSLLLWKGKQENFAALSCEPVYGYQGSGRAEYIVLDGQQRLTAIYYAFLAPDVPLPNRSNRFFYYVHVDKFMPEEYDEAFGYELQLKQMWRDAAPRLDAVETEKMNVYILQVMSILRQGYCSPKYLYFLLPGQEKPVRDPDGTRRKEILIPDIVDFQNRWNSAVDALESAIKVLQHPQEYGAVSSSFLPYVSILPVFAALRSYAKTLPAARQLDARRKLRHWYWASVFNNRYSGSVESTSARDFLDLKAWFDDDSAEPALIAEFAQRFRNLDLRKETKRGTSVYNGIFNLLVLQGARDWMTGDVPQHGDLDDHHIVPDSWGKKQIKGGLIGSILNRTPLTADTNRHVIKARLPNAYLPELIEQNGESTVRAILESHFISPAAFDILLRNPFGPDDFEAFISERQRTLQDAIENLLIKERLDLTPQLRDLDATTEQVELSVRKAVETALGGDGSQVPQHVLQKVDERITRAAKKSAALDMDRYQTLAGKLEYFDLRELQDTITSKTLWPQFEPRFANKESLITKFDQLAELRNGIRHSRAVSDIVRKEGEAAILWFKHVLNK
jgi:hypothetical protein